MEVTRAYAYSTSAWLSLQGLAIASDPHFALSFISAQAEKAGETTLNITRAISIPFFAIAILALLYPPTAPASPDTPSLSNSTTPSATTSSTDLDSDISATQPLPSQTMTSAPSLREMMLPLTTVLHALLCAFGYTSYMGSYSTGGSMFGWLYMVISGVFATMGGGMLLFGDESRPGRGAGWPFESKEKRGKRKEKWEARKERIKEL